MKTPVLGWLTLLLSASEPGNRSNCTRAFVTLESRQLQLWRGEGRAERRRGEEGCATRYKCTGDSFRKAICLCETVSQVYVEVLSRWEWTQRGGIERRKGVEATQEMPTMRERVTSHT